MTAQADVVVIGAGPYGLSVAAHLRGRGIVPQVFGAPMSSWCRAMPSGMRLKSEPFASSLSDPKGELTLGAYCHAHGLPYADLDMPVPVETFAAYGVAFARRFVPQLDERNVRRLRRSAEGFVVELDDGAHVAARAVVVAAGITPYKHLPRELAALPADRLNHTGDVIDYARFVGRDVVVVGAGASAIDASAALQRAGARVRLVTRRSAVRFHAAGRRRPMDAVLKPLTPLGPGWKKLLCVKAPLLFRRLPETLRIRLVKRYLGPAPGWHAREDFDGKVEVVLSSSVVAARTDAAGIKLELDGPDGRRCMRADHVVAGTGYDLDLDRLSLLDRDLAGAIEQAAGAPRLTPQFESTVPGLYFVGTAAAYTFGPMLRFVCGAEFASRRVAAQVATSSRRAASGVSSQDATGRGLPMRGIALPNSLQAESLR